MAHLTYFSFEFFLEIFTEDVSELLLYHGAKKSKMSKNPIQGGGGPALIIKTALCFVENNSLFTNFNFLQHFLESLAF